MATFIDRRNGNERRKGSERRDNPRLDLTHKRRRKGADRRAANRSMVDDYYAFEQSASIKKEQRINDAIKSNQL